MFPDPQSNVRSLWNDLKIKSKYSRRPIILHPVVGRLRPKVFTQTAVSCARCVLRCNDGTAKGRGSQRAGLAGAPLELLMERP